MATVKLDIEITKDKTGALQATVKDLEAVERQAKKTQTETKKAAEGVDAAFSSLQKDAEKLASGWASELGSAGNFLSALGPAGLAAAAGVGAVGTAIASSLGAAAHFVEGALTGFIEAGSKIQDLAERSGIGAEALQELGYAASLSGGSMEDMSSAMLKMQKNLEAGSGAFNKLGLDVRELKAMKPEDQFLAVADAIRNIEDPAEQSAAAMAVFGKGAASILPTLKDDLRAATEEARNLGIVMSADDVATADRLGDSVKKLTDAWGGFKNTIGAAAAEGLALKDTLATLNDLMGLLAGGAKNNEDAWRNFFAVLKDNAPGVQEIFRGLEQLQQLMGRMPELANATAASIKRGQQAVYGTSKIKPEALDAEANLRLLGAGLPEALAQSKEDSARAERERAARQKQLEDRRKDIDKFNQDMAIMGIKDFGAMQAAEDKIAKEGADYHTKTVLAGLAAEEKARKEAYEYRKKREEEENKVAAKWSEEQRRLLDAQIATVQELSNNFAQLGAALEMFGVSSESAFGKFISGISEGLAANAQIQKQMAEGNKLGAAVTGLNVLGSAYQKGSVGGGAVQGALAGAAFGPIGLIAGGVLGGIAGLFGKHKKQIIEAAKKASDDINKALSDMLAGKGPRDVKSFIPKLLKDKKTAMEEFQNLSDQFVQLQEEYKGKLIENQQAGIQGVVSMVEALGNAANTTQGDLDRMGTYTIAMFDTLRKQGVGFLQAVQMIKPAIDAIAKKAKDAGQEMPKALQDYQKFLEYGEKHAGLFDQAKGQGDVISALRHGGAIDTGNLADLSKDVLKNVNAIRGGLGAGGVDPTKAHTMALAQNAEALFQLKKASEQYGIALDAQTEAEIKAAENAGLFEGLGDPLDEMKASMDAMVQVLGAIATAFGATLPDAVKKYIDSLNKIPTPPVPGAPTGTEVPTPPPPTPHLASGGYIGKPTYALVGEAGPELVVPLDRARASSSLQDAARAVLGSRTSETHLNIGDLHINQAPGENAQDLANKVLATVVHGIRYNKGGLRTELKYASEGR